MPGYVVHDATGRKDMMSNLSYRKGLNAPDYFKKINTEEEFDKYFELCSKGEILSYEEFLELSKESSNFHFGYSSNPDIRKFIDLSFVDISKPFWKGYLTHLIGDNEAYKSVDLKKFQEDGSPKKILHQDWDKTNKVLQEIYQIPLLPEIKQLGIVNYIDGEPIYINVRNIIKVIEKMRHMSDEDFKNYISKL